MRALDSKLVGSAGERQTGFAGNLFRGSLGETWGGVETSADRCSAKGELIDSFQRIADPLQIIREHADVTGPFLAERQRRRVLHMGAADLHDAIPFSGLDGDRVTQLSNRRNQPLYRA